MLDFDAYLSRIGLAAADNPSWHAIHRAHATTIPFENLDSHRGIPVSLEQADLERKLVVNRRGGYCFEHNLLLASALEHMGLEVEPMLARVVVGGAARETRPTGHLALRVTDADGCQWHADVGFGLGTLLDPIPFGPTGVHEQSGWNFQVVEKGDELVLQTLGPDGWADVYTFPPRPVMRIDIEVSNWWTCTNPASRFVSGLIVSVSHDDGRREALYDSAERVLTVTTSPDGVQTTEVQRDEIPSLLAKRFGLPGFGLGPDGRVVAAS
ncbi:MAG: arylamine N-acetyltransferase [Actinobacteria bacterium]|nr:arylamine N-acetyltransferase [Actinomycetota bacterium]MBO0839066.1 arylamine N-acetyltransferase [Actinomycetota bacterium]